MQKKYLVLLGLLKNKNFILRTLFVLFLTSIFFANTLHHFYPDEFDNILGGWYIIHGKLPYVGFFTHHGPVSYFIAAFITLFSGQSFVRFRIFYALFLVLVTFLTYYFLKRRVGSNYLKFYPFFILFLGIEATYYWTHMLLADNIAAFSFLPIYALMIFKMVKKKKIDLVDLGFVSLLSSFGLYSSLSYTYLFLLINFLAFCLYLKENSISKPLLSRRNLYPFLVMAAPHGLFLIYLLVTRSIADYFYQNFVFNAKYYISNYPRPEGSTFINPMRYAIVIANDFLNNFYALFIGFKNFDFAFPVNMTMAVGNVAILIWLLFRKHYKLAIFIFLALIYTNVRGNPLTSGETDYQSAVYILFSFFNIFFLLPELYKSLEERLPVSQKLVAGLLFPIVGAYFFFTLFFLFLSFEHKVYAKYMGKAPLIYDRPKIAPIINTVVNKNEYMWIGPFEFEELFYANGRIPSKYHILIPGMGRSEKIKAEMILDFQRNKPKVIMFDKNFFIFGDKTEKYGKFFLDFLDENYAIILGYRKGDIIYRSVAPIHPEEKVDLEAKLYIRNDKVDEVIAKLLERNYIKEAVVE